MFEGSMVLQSTSGGGGGGGLLSVAIRFAWLYFAKP